MTRQLFISVLMFFFVLASCNKEEDGPQPGGNPTVDLPRYLLRSIEWDNGLKALNHYNGDSTVSHITFALGSAGGQVVYHWNGGKLSELYDDRSLYSNRFVYDNKGRLIIINNTSRQGQPAISYTLEYLYNNSNRLQTLNYYDVNEAGRQLKETTSYHYDANGNLAKVITQSGSSTITRRIDAYSDPVSFDYAHYLSASLSEHYTLYNYPVLSRVNKLPAKITKLVKTGAGAEQVEQVSELVYTIINYRLNKTVTRLTYPSHPTLNQVQEAVYFYE